MIYNIPKYIHKELMTAFKNTTSINGEFPIHNESANMKLAKILPVSSSHEIFNLKGGFTVYFDWSIQKFRVS